MLLLEEHLHQVEEMKNHIEAKKKLIRARRLPSQKKTSPGILHQQFLHQSNPAHGSIYPLGCAMDYHEKTPYQVSLVELPKV